MHASPLSPTQHKRMSLDSSSILAHRHQAVPDTLQRIRHSENHYSFSSILGKSRKHDTKFLLSCSEPIQLTRNSNTAEKLTHGRHSVHSPLCPSRSIMCVCERVRACVCVRACVGECGCAYINMCMHMCICVSMYVCVCVPVGISPLNPTTPLHSHNLLQCFPYSPPGTKVWSKIVMVLDP